MRPITDTHTQLDNSTINKDNDAQHFYANISHSIAQPT